MQGGKSKAEAWDCCLIDLVQAASHHSYVYVLDAFVQSVEKARNKCKDSNVSAILSKLLELFVLNRINKVSQIFLMDGFMNEKHIDLIEKKIRGLLLEIRKQAVPLTDAFDLPDFLVNSPLGKSDGDIYNAYMQTVKSAPGAMSKAPYWDELVKPCLRKDLA
jgi:acyl-CoA oxidase